MSKELQLVGRVLDNVHRAVQMKASVEIGNLRKAVVREIYIKQFGEVEDELSEAIEPMFVAQMKSIAKGLEKLDTGDKSLAPVSDQAQDLIAQVFDPQEWHDELVDRALPVIAKKMLEAARAQLRVMGFDRG